MDNLEAQVKTNRKRMKPPVDATKFPPKSYQAKGSTNTTPDDSLTPEQQGKQKNVKNIRINKTFVQIYFYLFTQVMFKERNLY